MDSIFQSFIQAFHLIFQLNAEHGTTLVLVTHDEMLARRCTRQIRLAGGRVEGG